MKDNKNHSASQAEKEFNNEAASNGRKATQYSRYESNPEASKGIDENNKLTRRYSFDDNGGGYLGL
jgi:hypothetical protein